MAQRFSDAVNALESVKALAAEVKMQAEREFFRNLFSRAAKAAKNAGFSP